MQYCSRLFLQVLHSPFYKSSNILTCLHGTSGLHLSQNIQFPTGSRKRPPLVCRDAIMDSRYIETEESGAKTSIKISSQDWMQPEQRRCRGAQAAVIYLFVFVTSDKFICPTSHLSSHQCPILHHYLPNINTILLIYIWRQQTDSYTSQSTGVSAAISGQTLIEFSLLVRTNILGI